MVSFTLQKEDISLRTLVNASPLGFDTFHALRSRRLVLGIRVFFGRANISRKTLVDDRFLL